MIARQDHVNPRKSDMVSMRSSIVDSMNSWDSIYQQPRRKSVDVCVGLGGAQEKAVILVSSFYACRHQVGQNERKQKTSVQLFGQPHKHV